MNYIIEINAFYDWLETNELTSSAIALWHALMSIANKTGWQTSFAVATSVLGVKTKLKKQAIQEARTLLQQKGRIIWKSRGGNKAAIYEIIPFASCAATVKQPQEHTQGNAATVKRSQEHTQEHPQEHTQQQSHQPHINKLNETKQNETEENNSNSSNPRTRATFSLDPEDFGSEEGATVLAETYNPIAAAAVEYYRRNIYSFPGLRELEDLNDWASQVELAVIKYAIDEAVTRGVRNIGYVNSILRAKQSQGLTTKEKLEQFKADERNRKAAMFEKGANANAAHRGHNRQSGGTVCEGDEGTGQWNGYDLKLPESFE